MRVASSRSGPAPALEATVRKRQQIDNAQAVMLAAVIAKHTRRAAEQAAQLDAADVVGVIPFYREPEAPAAPKEARS